MQAHPDRRSSEHVLFLSLWAVLLLALAMWYFWPGPLKIDTAVAPRVTAGEELTPWFQEISVSSFQPSQYTLQLTLKDSYLESLGNNTRTIHLSFEFIGESRSVLERGNLPCTMSSADRVVTLNLRNPNRVNAREILLSLAH